LIYTTNVPCISSKMLTAYPSRAAGFFAWFLMAIVLVIYLVFYVVLSYIIYSYKYLESDLIKHCHLIVIHSLGQPLIVRSHSKVHRSRGNPKEIPMWASRVSHHSYFPWFNRQQTWRPATGSSL